jgi:RNA polymerase sigma factor (sigma-70 family)
MRWLNIIASQHSEWVSLALRFGAGNEAEDMVQEMYLHLNKYIKDPSTIIKDGKVNKAFIWVALRNLIRYRQKRDSKGVVSYYDQLYDPVAEPYDHEEAEAFETLIDNIYDSTDDLHWYYGAMFKLYFTTDQSMRNISEGSKISLKNIFETIKKTKEHVKENNQEDYQDYKNQDYEHIKRLRRHRRKDH